MSPNSPRTALQEAEAARRAGWDLSAGPAPGDHGLFVDALRPVFMSKPLGLLARVDFARLLVAQEAEQVRQHVALQGLTAAGSAVDVPAQLAAALGQEGFVEGPGNDQPFGAWQGVLDAAWCDSFAQWAAVMAGGFRWPDRCQFGEKGDAYCPFTESHAEELGLLIHVGFAAAGGVPPGWQVLYSWQRNEWCDHIGTVVRQLDNGNLVVVEGNYRDAVALVERDWTYIRSLVALPAAEAGPRDGPIGPPPPIVKEDQLALSFVSVPKKTTLTIPMPPAQRSGGLPWGGVFVNIAAGSDPEPSDDDYAVRVQINRNDGVVRGVPGQSEDGLVHLRGRRKWAVEIGPGDESITVYNPGNQALVASVEAAMLG